MARRLAWLVVLLASLAGAAGGRVRGAQHCPAVNGTQCSGHGLCVDHDSNGHHDCFCQPGWKGAACAEPTCISHCSARGKCNPETHLCECDTEWEGLDCSISRCPRDCSGRGLCRPAGEDPKLRVCFCRPGWKGADCSSRVCPVNEHYHECSGNGLCRNGTCSCDPGWKGMACDQRTCVHPCVNGVCKCPGGDCKCECAHGFVGQLCDRTCPDGCSGHGTCNEWGRCLCHDGFHGANCSQRACPNDCSHHGECTSNGTCVCKPGRRGADCSETACPQLCNWRLGHGECIFDKCECYPGYTGNACETLVPAAEVLEKRPCGEDCFDHCRMNSDCEFAAMQVFQFQHDAMGSVEVAVPGADLVDADVSAVTGRAHSQESRKCYLGCLRTCMQSCFQVIHALPADERELAEQALRDSLEAAGEEGLLGTTHIAEAIEGEVAATGSASSKAAGDMDLAGLVDNLQQNAAASEA